MAQHDYVISNGTGSAVRSDLNNALAAIVSNNSGATEPTPTYAYQFWADTTTGILKIRNAANSAWVALRELDGTLVVEDGTASAPGFAFASDLNTGLYRVGSDQLGITTGGTNRLLIDSTGQIEAVSLGTAAAPVWSFTTDPNTGIYSPGADQVAISTNGSGRLFVNSSGSVGIGTSNPGAPLDVVGSVNTVVLSDSATNAALKQAKIQCRHYTSSEENLMMIYAISDSSANEINIGGGSSAQNYATQIGFWTAANNTSTTGTERLRITSAGNVGIGTTSPQRQLHVANTGTTYIRVEDSTNSVRTEIVSDSTGGIIGTQTSHSLAFNTGNTERARIDSSGRLLVGTSSARGGWYSTTGTTLSPVFQTDGTSFNASSIALVHNDTNALEAARILLGRSRGSTAGSFTSVQNGDDLGAISFQGADGTKFLEGAQIKAFVDGAPGANDLPTRLVFSVTADGSASPTEAMRLENTGTMRVSGTIYRDGSCGLRFSASSLLPMNSTGGNSDNAIDLGASGNRWRVVYAGTGAINTSDANEKQDIEDLDSAELAVAITIKGLIKKYRFKDAIAEKGDDARIHVGVIAQEIEQAFVDEGLDPRRYGMFCEDTLEDGSKRLGIRYDELLAFVIAAL